MVLLVLTAIMLKFCALALSPSMSHHENHTCSHIIRIAACVNAVVQLEAWASELAV